MFGGSSFGQSPFASPPFLGVVRRVGRWLAGLPGALWGTMAARAGWGPGTPTENIGGGEPGAGWESDTPRNDWGAGTP